MKVIIAGSRSIIDPKLLVDTICACPFTITEVVCGEARGVDRLGRAWAESHQIPIKSLPAEWDRFGRGAGFIRNRAMAEYADALILIWDGQSHGSANMKHEAARVGIPTHEVIVNGAVGPPDPA